MRSRPIVAYSIPFCEVNKTLIASVKETTVKSYNKLKLFSLPCSYKLFGRGFLFAAFKAQKFKY